MLQSILGKFSNQTYGKFWAFHAETYYFFYFQKLKKLMQQWSKLNTTVWNNQPERLACSPAGLRKYINIKPTQPAESWAAPFMTLLVKFQQTRDDWPTSQSQWKLIFAQAVLPWGGVVGVINRGLWGPLRIWRAKQSLNFDQWTSDCKWCEGASFPLNGKLNAVVTNFVKVRLIYFFPFWTFLVVFFCWCFLERNSQTFFCEIRHHP